MRFATRTFLWSFIPFALLLTGSFWAIQKLTLSVTRNQLRSSLRQTEIATARARSKEELQGARFLKVVGDNAPLKAGLQLMLLDPKSGDARRTVEDQLREICNALSFDFLLASNPDGQPIAGVIRAEGGITAMSVPLLRPPGRGFFSMGEFTYQVTSVPVDQGEENIGVLSVGERFDLSESGIPAVLIRDGRVMKSSVPGVPFKEIESALRRCGIRAECELRLHGQTYMSTLMNGANHGDGFRLRSLQNVDSAIGPLQAILRNVFLVASIGAVLAGLVLSVVSSRSIVKPLADVVAHLRQSASTGVLPEFRTNLAAIQEVRELMESFNHAAAVIRKGEEDLHHAYVEFVGSLASALDARDRYTAGHSTRVGEHACAIAEAMNLTPKQVEELRIGALLHDIGKIGVSDSILDKPGRLTSDEFALIQEHPTIGRRILEGVNGFHTWLPTVELHHENWDGTGYPMGLSGESIPLGARIVHVADAYDAMTSDRPYRRGMDRGKAMAILQKFAGTQFDPVIVQAFAKLMDIDAQLRPAA